MRVHISLAVAAALACAALLAPAARAQERPCDRVASPNGSIRTPLQLVRKLRPGQVGCFRRGTYRSTTRIRRGGITLRNYPGERVRWRARVVIAAPRVTIEGLLLDGTGRRHTLPSPTIHGPDAVIRGNEIVNRTGICVHPVRRYGLVPDRFLVERNRIHDCGRRPATNHDHGVYVADGRGGTVRHNLIWHSADRGVQLYPFARGTSVYENTIDRNGQGVHFGASSSGNVVERNVVTRSRLRWNVETFALSGGGNAVRDNCVYANRPGFTARGGVEPGIEDEVQLGPNVVTSLPYVAPSRGDYRLRPSTPCAGRGAPPDVSDFR